MKSWVPSVYWLDRWDVMKGVLQYVSAFEHVDELGGSDTSELVTFSDVEKGDRLLWRDEYGKWHEHIVVQVVEERGNGRTVHVYGENSICETLNDYVEDRRVDGGSAAVALSRVLESTRWEVGTVDDLGEQTWNAYQVSAREAISTICETWGGELETDIQAGGTGVLRRRVSVLARRGGDTGKRFTYRKDLVKCTRTVMENEVKTAMYGYGKGEEKTAEDGTPTGGYGRKLTFADINGGLEYVADEDALKRWGRPDGKGGRSHSFGSVTFDDCEDMKELMRLTKEALADACEPQVSYEVEAVNLASAGLDYEHEGCNVGDTVRIVDTSYEPELRLTGRVLKKVVRYGMTSQATVTLGNIVPVDYATMGDLAEQMDALREQAGKWDWAAGVESSYVSAVIAGLNELFDSVGGHVYVSPEDGIMVFDRAQDDNPTMAMQLNGAGFRIANEKNSDGTWRWRTFGTGDGFTADELTVGTIRGGSNYWNLETGDLLFEKGTIQDLGGNNSWNLTTGDMVLGGDLTIKNGRIQSADGTSYWDLTTGQMQLDFAKTNGVASKDDVQAVQQDTQAAYDAALAARSEAQDAAAEAENVQFDVNLVKNKTDRITFDENGMTIAGTDGSTYTVATYTSQGIYIDTEIFEINSAKAAFAVKDWGLWFGGEPTVFCVTDGTGDMGDNTPGLYASSSKGSGDWFSLSITADGIWFNSPKYESQGGVMVA